MFGSSLKLEANRVMYMDIVAVKSYPHVQILNAKKRALVNLGSYHLRPSIVLLWSSERKLLHQRLYFSSSAALVKR
jgi:hypothetical protein